MPILLIIATLLAGSPGEGTEAKASVHVLEWFKMNPAELGCWLENTYGHRDAKWNCDVKRYQPQGDPCHDVVAYYDGPTFPRELAGRVHPLLRAISLKWEHGELQQVVLRFSGALSEQRARAMFDLPAHGVPDSFQAVELQSCSRKGPCLLVEKFEHLGAGEADCDGAAAPRDGSRETGGD